MVLTFLDKDGAGSSSHPQPRRPLEASGKAPLIQVDWRGGGGSQLSSQAEAGCSGRGRAQGGGGLGVELGVVWQLVLAGLQLSQTDQPLESVLPTLTGSCPQGLPLTSCRLSSRRW